MFCRANPEIALAPATAGRVLDHIAVQADGNALTAFRPRGGRWWRCGMPRWRGQRSSSWCGSRISRTWSSATTMPYCAPPIWSSCSASPRPPPHGTLTDLTLDPPSATSDEAGAPLLDEDYLILSTIHSAKGQEWKAVFVLNVVDGCIPSDMATGKTEEIEEERRLPLCGHDAGQGSARPDRAASLLPAWPVPAPATSTSMPHAAGLFQPALLVSSRRVAGRLRRTACVGFPASRVCRWTSQPECAGDGAAAPDG